MRQTDQGQTFSKPVAWPVVTYKLFVNGFM